MTAARLLLLEPRPAGRVRQCAEAKRHRGQPERLPAPAENRPKPDPDPAQQSHHRLPLGDPGFAGGVLRALGPEVYSSTESGVIGGGQSTWRFQAFAAGQGRLRLTSQQPWEPEAEPVEVFDCAITVN
jgi:hypothetical protein